VLIGAHVCVSQAVYLCTGNHDWSLVNMKLFRKPIVLERGSWIGARAVVCPGVVVGEGAIVTVASVASKNVPPYEIHAGNPAGFVRRRILKPVLGS
jgi:putative colanic acid biosynthesis acetyltransferase WcaF